MHKLSLEEDTRNGVQGLLLGTEGCGWEGGLLTSQCMPFLRSLSFSFYLVSVPYVSRILFK